VSAAPILLLDRMGLSHYHDLHGSSLLDTSAYSLRLVTSLRALSDHENSRAEAVVGVGHRDERALLAAARFLANFDGRSVERVLALTERLLLPAALVRDELDLPGQRMAEALPFRNKLAMKRHVRAAGIRVPDFAAYSTDSALRLLDEHKRVVIKPVSEAGSRDVFIVSDFEGIRKFESAFQARVEEFEVEEFIEGDLFHVDSLVQNGQVVAATAGRSVGSTTAFESQAAFCDIAVPAGVELERLLDFNRDVLASHSSFTGVSHHEIFHSGDELVFCEIAARAGGGGIVPAFARRTGIHLVEAMVQAQLHDVVPVPRSISAELTGYVLLYPEPGVLDAPIEVPADDWIIHRAINVKPGESIGRPNAMEEAAAVVTVVGDTVSRVEERLAEVVSRTLISTRDS
jgi:biotin carboxylase